MKIIRIGVALLVLVGLSLGATGAVVATDNVEEKKVVKVVKKPKCTLWHKALTKGQPNVLISVSPSAVPAHLAHGDFLFGKNPKQCYVIVPKQ